MRVLALADGRPPADPAELVAANAPELVVTLGDLEPDWIASLASTDVPKLGVHGNHDGEDDLRTLGIDDLHRTRVEVGGWSFAGFEGSVRVHAPGPHLFSQDEAARLVRDLQPADVLVCHSPPLGINDDPDDPAHVGFKALRDWVERHQPRYVLHGHTTPDPADSRLATRPLGIPICAWVRIGAMRYRLRQRLISIGDDYWIEDEDGRQAFRVDGKALRIRKTFVLEDAAGNEVAKLQERKLSVRDKMEIERGGRSVASVKKALIGIRDRFSIEVENGADLSAKGNLVDHEYEIKREGGTVAKISKRWFRVRDTYGVEIAEGEDDALVLAITVCIDAMTHPRE